MKNNLKILSIITFSLVAFPAMAVNSFLRPTNFPTTSNDASFTDRTQNATTGYKPYADRSAYQTIEIESEEEYINRLVSMSEGQRIRDEQTLTTAQYCTQYPLDDTRCPQAPGLTESIIAIGNRPTATTTVALATPPKPSIDIPVPQTLPSFPIVQNTPTTTPASSQTNITYNATCTPPQHSDHFPNKILTTGRYASIDPAFEKAMITVFRTEGECINDHDDTGGYTCYGISQNNNPEIDVRNITRADAEDIAYRKYYTNYNINQLPDTSRGNVFMLGWGAGTSTGIRRFCKFLGIPEKNKIDPDVISATENYHGDIHNDFLDNQQQFYIEISKRGNNKKYLKGWMNRIRLMRENGCHSETTTPITR